MGEKGVPGKGAWPRFAFIFAGFILEEFILAEFMLAGFIFDGFMFALIFALI